MTLTEKVSGSEIDNWSDLKEHQYMFLERQTGEKCNIIFKCPGCGEPLSVTNFGEPHWNIDFETLTATPSIRHKRDGIGCGWHGYLTNGELKGQIE